MKYLDVCSGISAPTVAWDWECVGYSEIEKFPSAVLSYHYPDTPNYGDMTEHENWPTTDIDVLVGGTPCQSFSVAGLRQGMADPRGNLALVYLAVADQYRPRWLVWENVPGVLSSNEGRDFGALVGAMVELGYSPCWRVLDAQYFGVAQRRRRVFVVASSGDWTDSAKVLFEPESLRRNPPPGRGEGKDLAGTLGGSSQSGGFRTTDLDNSGAFIPETVGALTDGAHNGGGLTARTLTPVAYSPPVANPLTHRMHKGINTTLDEGQTPIVTTGADFDVTAFNARQDPDSWPDRAVPLDALATQAVAFAQNQRAEVRTMEKAGALAAESGMNQQTFVAFHTANSNMRGPIYRKDQFMTLEPHPSQTRHAILGPKMAVRRLTPLECERLQGFPDGYTDIPGASDSARYKALGNSMAVPVMKWIGKRIEAIAEVEDDDKQS